MVRAFQTNLLRLRSKKKPWRLLIGKRFNSLEVNVCTSKQDEQWKYCRGWNLGTSCFIFTLETFIYSPKGRDP